MTDHTVDPKLLSQIEELRQLLARSLQQHPHLVTRCVALTQRLDHVALQLRQNPTDESSAWRALAEIGEALAAAERQAPPAPTFDLLRETLPPQPRYDAQLANQARLVEHLSAQPHTLDAAQAALRDYAAQRPLASTLPHPAALQQALSTQLAATAPLASTEARLVPLTDLPRLQQALATSAPLSGLDPAQPHLPSSGDLQRDLRALADRYLTSTPHATSTEDLVLARIEADPQGNIRGVHLHPIQALTPAPATPQARAADAAPASPTQDAAQSALHTHAAVALLRRRVTELRQGLSTDRADADASREALATEQRRLAALEALAADAQQRLSALAADAQQRDAAEQAITATRDAASQSLQQHTSQLAQTAQSFIQSLQHQAQSATGVDRQALLALRDRVDQWLQSPTLQAPTPEGLQQHAAALQGIITQSHSAAPASAQPLLSHLATQAADARDRAAIVGAALSWSPLASTPTPTPAPALPTSEAELYAARSLVASHASHFQQSAYAAATTEDRLLAVEQPFASFLRDLPPTTRAPIAPLVTPAAPTPHAAPTPSLNLSAITAQSAALLHQLRGLPAGAQAAPSVNLYTDAAGLELPRAAAAALSTSDAVSTGSAEMVDRSLQRALFQLGESTKQAQHLAASVAHLAATRSGQRDLGFNDAASPLFKRKIGVSRDAKVDNVLLPALRQVSGLAPGATPAAERGERGELATGPRAEAQAIQARQTSLLSSLERVFNQLLPSGQTAALVNDAVQSATGAQRALSRFERAAQARAPLAAQSDAQRAYAIESQELTKALHAEAQSVPMDVASKLGPVTDEVGVDFSSIRLYNGPRAAQLADAMGAHAFAMGKHIFGRFDLSSVQGLAVLAHEATHTTHYNDPSSVTQKEQEAEAVERKAVQHLSGGRYELALEPPTSSLKRDGALRASGVRGLLDAAAPNPNDLIATLSTGGDASHAVVARVAGFIMKRMKRDLSTDAERVGKRPL